MQRVTIPYSGTLLVSHMAAYGLGFALNVAGIDAFVGHDPESQSFEPFVAFDADMNAAEAAVRASASQSETIVEDDLVPGKSGNDRRATIWARASLDADAERLRAVVERRATLVEGAVQPVPLALLGGLGAPVSWGGALKTSYGATALDGVLGNHTSDFVRGVLRPTRAAAAIVDRDLTSALQPDKTGWAPPGTQISYVHQWLAALGLALLPVAHQQLGRSQTPACWSTRSRRPDRVTLPLLVAPVSVPRLRALLALEALAGPLDGDDRGSAPGVLRGYGVDEAVVFQRRDRAGAGSSVAFFFGRGERVGLR